MKGKCSTHLVNVPEASTSSESNYFNEHGDPMYAHMVSVKEINCKEHLIQFQISTDLEKVRNMVENSTKCPTVLLKADTSADVNLMNAKTFDTLFKDRTVLQPSSLKMEAYGNNTLVEVLGRCHTFHRWKGKVYRQLFYVANANNLPNLLLRDGCYTLSVIKPCYSVKSTGNSSKFQGNPEVAPTQSASTSEKATLHVGLSVHCRKEGSKMVKQTDSRKHSAKLDEMQGAPLTKQQVLDVYSDDFTGTWKFPGATYKFQLRPNAKPLRHGPH